MMKIFGTLVATLLFNIVLIGQQGLSVKIVESGLVDDRQCIDIKVNNNTADEINLSSQNYRMYYGSGNLMLDESSMALRLPSEIYQFKLVQHVSGVDASDRGPLDFDDNLAFINFSIVHNNIKQKGASISTKDLSIVEMCFKVLDKSKPMSIVLAREDSTAAYGRAYIELSALNEGNELKSTEIGQYTDFIVR